MKGNTHEDLSRAVEHSTSSDRSFGLVMSGAAALFALGPLLRGGHVRLWLLAVAAVLLVVTFTRASLLHYPNRAWTALVLLLSRIVNPVVMAILFYVVVTPTGMLLRAMGKDLLRLRYEPNQNSYWISRTPPGPAPGTMNRQF